MLIQLCVYIYIYICIYIYIYNFKKKLYVRNFKYLIRNQYSSQYFIFVIGTKRYIFFDKHHRDRQLSISKCRRIPVQIVKRVYFVRRQRIYEA